MKTQEIEKAAEDYSKEYWREESAMINMEEAIIYSMDNFKAGVEFSDKHWQEKTRWIPVEERLPKYGVAVLVKRPNKYSGNVDILLARLHQAKKEGQEYGRGDGMGSYPKTFKDYWSLPSIALLSDITHWKEIG